MHVIHCYLLFFFQRTTQAFMGAELGPAGMGPVWYGSDCCTRWPRANEVAFNCVCGHRIHEGCLTDLLRAYRHDGCPVCCNATTPHQRRGMYQNLIQPLSLIVTYAFILTPSNNSSPHIDFKPQSFGVILLAMSATKLFSLSWLSHGGQATTPRYGWDGAGASYSTADTGAVSQWLVASATLSHPIFNHISIKTVT